MSRSFLVSVVLHSPLPEGLIGKQHSGTNSSIVLGSTRSGKRRKVSHAVHPTFLLLVWIASALGTSCLGAGEPARNYDRLVEQLGDASFRVREEAARQLEQAGLAARQALLHGLKSPDLEVRMGAHRLLTRVLQQDFERKLVDFVRDGKSRVGAELPGWKRFRQWFGQDRKTREFYVAMLRRELPLLDTLAHDTPAGAIELAARRRLDELARARLLNGTREEISMPSIATLLFVTAQPELHGDTIMESRFYTLLMPRTIKQRILTGPHSAILKRLLEKWIMHANKDQRSYYAIRITLSFELKQLGVTLGRKILQDPQTMSSMLTYAAIALARFGDRSDARFLLPHLDNRTVCHTWSNPRLKKEPIRIEVRDVILAMLIYMTGQDPKDFGYKLLAPDPDTIYRIYTFGFLSDAERDKAFKKWNDWYSAHGKSLTGSTTKQQDAPAANKKNS